MNSDERLIPVETGGHVVLVSVIDSSLNPFEERPVGPDGHPELKLQDALAGVAEVAGSTFSTLAPLEWSSLTLEFGLEFALESGKLAAVIGKVSSSATASVKLEFTRPSN